MTSNRYKDRFHELCVKHSISQEIECRLWRQVEYLSTFKKEIFPESKTATQRAKALEEIEKLAEKLAKAVEALSFGDRCAIDNTYFGVDLPGFDDVHALVDDACAFDLGETIIPGIGAAAKAVRDSLAGVGVKGAAETVSRHADFVRCIAFELMKANIKPSYGGIFLDFCKVIFEAAGVTLSEKPIRYFMQKMRPSLKAAGYCL